MFLTWSLASLCVSGNGRWKSTPHTNLTELNITWAWWSIVSCPDLNHDRENPIFTQASDLLGRGRRRSAGKWWDHSGQRIKSRLTWLASMLYKVMWSLKLFSCVYQVFNKLLYNNFVVGVW
jgi:hypothetical protein